MKLATTSKRGAVVMDIVEHGDRNKRFEKWFLRAVISLASLYLLQAFVQLGLGQQEVILSPRPSGAIVSVRLEYSGGNLVYVGKAPAPTTYTHTFSVATCTAASATWPNCTQMTNIVDSSNTATATIASHGLKVGDRITVAGASDADLNGTYVVATVADANTLTFTSANTTDSTYSTGITITTRAPRGGAPLWSIQSYKYDGSNNLVGVFTSGANAVWDSRTTTTYY